MSETALTAREKIWPAASIIRSAAADLMDDEEAMGHLKRMLPNLAKTAATDDNAGIRISASNTMLKALDLMRGNEEKAQEAAKTSAPITVNFNFGDLRTEAQVVDAVARSLDLEPSEDEPE